MRIAVLKETFPGERRVALTPQAVGRLAKVKDGPAPKIVVQAGAGGDAFPDAHYEDAGARVTESAGAVLEGGGICVRVRKPSLEEAGQLPYGATLIGLLQPLTSPDLVQALAKRKVQAFALDAIPRITRAQSMDALSSQAVIAGYEAALAAAQMLPKIFPMLMTAAGTVTPAKVLVLGAGVAGLQAIATCRRLGAVVQAYDVRAAAAEEVRSLGAKFVELPLETQEGAGGYAREQSDEFLRKQRELLGQHAAQSDVVITTANVPGRKAPVLLTAEMVKGMKPGSVVVDIAAESGGNCELTEPDRTVVHGGVSIHGFTNPAGHAPAVSSELYAKNVTNLLALMTKDGELKPDFADEIVGGCCITRDGEVVHEATRQALETAGSAGGRT